MSGLETSSGEELRRRSVENGPNIVAVDDFQVQPNLSKIAFPGDPHPMERWISEGDLASRFRAYVKDPTLPEEKLHIDVSDKHALAELFEAVKEHPPEPETVH